jgi:putative transposase
VGTSQRQFSGEHRDWLLERTKARDFTLRGLVAELAERGLKVDYRAVWNFVHAEKLSFKKKPWWPASAIDPTSRIGGRSGASIKTASSLSVWSSSTRPGPGPT